MSGINKSKSGWLKDATQPRTGETIGGGYFVFRRGDGTNRIRPSQWPFEYGTEEAAIAQAAALAAANPGFTFIVVHEIAGAFVAAAYVAA